jgi:hypothetical protein
MGKINSRKNYILVLDVETAGGLENPLVYDIGYAVTDKQGNIYESRSYIISEIFDDKNLMNSAYYAEKVPMYKKDIAEGKRTVVSFEEMRLDLLTLMKEYNIDTISAYNLNFDKRALSNTMKYITGYKKFLTADFKNVKMLCIWSLACEVLYTQKTFRKVAESQGWVTEKGNLRTSAEIGHRYINLDFDFEESHTGLEDVFIEIGIMEKCFRQKKSYKSGILPNPWRIPNGI